MIRRTRGRLQLILSRSVVRAHGWRGSESVWHAELPFGSPTDLPEILGVLAGGIPQEIGTRDLEIVVEPPLLQQRDLQGLPPVRAMDLRALVQQQSSQFFRQNGSPLVADACWLPGGRGRPRMAHAVAADELLVESVIEAAASAGFSVTAVRPGPALGETRLTLLPRTRQIAHAARAAHSLRRAGLAVAGLWLVVALFLVGRVIGERRFIDVELIRLAQPLAAVRDARLQIHGAETLLQEVARARV
ncbi:MAG: hypothetical protein SGJ01_03055, partial [Gemmatimonadota bacterium]|nr:hypothetical protein [Gemmatimonadota bacterium]